MTTPYVRLPFPEETSLAELYHENTKLHPYTQEVEAGAEEEFPPSEELAYGHGAPLPDPRVTRLDARLEDVVRARRSTRAFDPDAHVPLAALSKLLHLTYGITGHLDDGAPARAAPSAGARYPLELYVAARRVEGLAPGIHHYHVATHALEPVRAGDPSAELDRIFFAQPLVRDASFLLLVGAAFPRTMLKYADRGYRLILLDAGHAMQNALLAATALGLGGTPLGGFLDDALTDLVGLNTVDEHVVYAAGFGKPR